MSRRVISNKSSRPKGAKNALTRKTPSSDDHAKLTIRLSDIGIIKRSPSEQDLQIQGIRVGNVLDGIIKKLQLAVCLPKLLRKDACQLRRVLQPQEVDFIIAICSKYIEMTTPGCLEESSLAAILFSLDKISMHDTKKKSANRYNGAIDTGHLADPHMAQVMEMLWSNRALREKVLAEFHLIEKNSCTVFVNCLISLKDVADYKFNMTAIQERSRDEQLRKAWKSNALLLENIQKAEELLAKQREGLGEQWKIKKRIVEDYQRKIHVLENKFKDDIKHRILESEADMADDSQGSKFRQVDLAAEAKSVTHQYESLLAQHLAYERTLRAKRFKVESQLCTWLAKYDADIGERQAEFEEITKGYQEEMIEMEALELRFNEQEVEYVELMAEKAAEERRIWEEKAFAFLKNRSARRIQRYWRAYRQRKIDKKKAKKAKAKARKEKSMEKVEGAESGGGPPPPPEKVGKDKKGAKGKAKAKGKGKGKDKGKKEEQPPPSEIATEVMDWPQGEESLKTEIVVDLSLDLDDDDD